MENNTINQSVLAEDISSKINYEFMDSYLVKPLDPIKVTKEFSKPVSDKKPVKDENGVEAVDFDEVETEVKEVDSDYRKGIVLKVPLSMTLVDNSHIVPVKVGDVVLFRERSASFFDLLKDSRMIKYYDIVAIEKSDRN